MGSSGSRTTSTQAAEYPPEFRPLAQSAVQQIQALQQSLPITMFSEYQPAGTAGLSPLQEFAINQLVPATMRPTPGLQGGLQTPGAVGAAAQGATAAGEPTQAANAALATLGSRLAQSPGQLPSTAGLQQNFAANLPGNYAPASAFPGLSEAQIQGMGDMASRATPILGGPGVAAVNPTQPGQFPDPYLNIRPPVNQEQQLLKLQLNPQEGSLFDGYIAQGRTPQEAFRLVMDRRVSYLAALRPPAPPPTPEPVESGAG